MVLKWLKLKKRSRKTAEEVYLTGIDSLIERDTDRAIEELVKLAKLNPDTAETYMALGNLFRAKGDTERAIQVHRSLMHRAGIDPSLKIQARYNLALDLRKAGFIERSISAFEEILGDHDDHLPSLEALVELYEESRNWLKAMSTQEKIARIRKNDYSNIIAHHLTELGKQQEREGKESAAIKYYHKAISKDPNCLDAYLHLGDLLLKQNKPKQAIEHWKKVLQIQPELGHLTYPRLEKAFRQIGKEDEFEQLIETLRDLERPNLYARLALAQMRLEKGDSIRARIELTEILEKQPRFWEARILFGKTIISEGNRDKAFEQYQQILDVLMPPETNFQCQRCGHELHELAWKCPRCGAWDTIMLKSFLGISGSE